MAKVVRSAEALNEILASSDKLRALAVRDPVVMKALADGLIKYLPTPAFVSSESIYMVVVVALGLVVVSAIVGVLWLASTAADGFQVPETVTALASAAIGALAGLLAPSPGSKSG